MNAALDALATELYVAVDDLLMDYPHLAPDRPAVGIAPQFSDAELVTLAVLQALLGYHNEARFIRYAHAHLRHLFPDLPQRPAYNKRLRRSVALFRRAGPRGLGRPSTGRQRRPGEPRPESRVITGNAERERNARTLLDGVVMAGIAIITEACIDVKDRACVDVCPVQCIYELDMSKGVLFSEDEAGSSVIENTHTPNPDAIGIFSDSLLYVNVDECTSCTACYQDDVCPVGAIYPEEEVPDGVANTTYNRNDPNKGHDHSFFIQLTRDVFAD